MSQYLNLTLLFRVAGSLLLLILALLTMQFSKRGLRSLARKVNLPAQGLLPLQVLINCFLFLVTVYLILQVIFQTDVNGIMTNLWAILAMVAIGFVAMWSVLSNFLCTFVLIFFKPFSVGDRLTFPTDAIQGTVVDLNLIFTTLQTEDEGFCQIPNNMFFQKVFKIHPGARTVELEEQLKRDTKMSTR